MKETARMDEKATLDNMQTHNKAPRNLIAVSTICQASVLPHYTTAVVIKYETEHQQFIYANIYFRGYFQPIVTLQNQNQYRNVLINIEGGQQYDFFVSVHK